MSKIQIVIKQVMDKLQDAMENNLHIEQPEVVYNLMDKAGIYFAHMTDEDKDYYQAAQYAIEERINWKL